MHDFGNHGRIYIIYISADTNVFWCHTPTYIKLLVNNKMGDPVYDTDMVLVHLQFVAGADAWDRHFVLAELKVKMWNKLWFPIHLSCQMNVIILDS